MTAKQIEILKKLGFEDTQEEGAILKHRSIYGMSCWVWEDSKFDEIISSFIAVFEKSLRGKIANEITR